jgi:lipopolysaccharide transport system ATP-binding protein
MYVRLAFAVAAHLEPDILVVDEVLAVGDAEFQKKAIGKMQDISSGGGRTVLFVSHNMGAVKNLCKSSILIDKGRIINFDSTDKIISHYLQNKSRLGDNWILTEISPSSVYYTKISCTLQEDNYVLILNVELLSIKEHKPAFVAINISNSLGDVIMQAIPFYEPFIHFGQNKGHKLKITINMPPLVPGEYYCDAWIGSNYTETLDYRRNVVSFKILKAPSEKRTFPYSSNLGYIVPQSECIFQ